MHTMHDHKQRINGGEKQSSTVDDYEYGVARGESGDRHRAMGNTDRDARDMQRLNVRQETKVR